MLLESCLYMCPQYIIESRLYMCLEYIEDTCIARLRLRDCLLEGRGDLQAGARQLACLPLHCLVSAFVLPRLWMYVPTLCIYECIYVRDSSCVCVPAFGDRLARLASPLQASIYRISQISHMYRCVWTLVMWCGCVLGCALGLSEGTVWVLCVRVFVCESACPLSASRTALDVR